MTARAVRGCRTPGAAALLMAFVFCLEPGPPAGASAPACPRCGHNPCICGGRGGRPGHSGGDRGPLGGGGFGLSVDLGRLFQAKPKADPHDNPPEAVPIKDNDHSEKKPRKPAAKAPQDDDCAALLKKVQAADQSYAEADEELQTADREYFAAWKALEKQGKRDGEASGDLLDKRRWALRDAENRSEQAKDAGSDAKAAGEHKGAAERAMKTAKDCDRELNELIKKNPKLEPLIAEVNRTHGRLERARDAEAKARRAFETLRKDYTKHCGAKYRGIVESKKKAGESRKQTESKESK